MVKPLNKEWELFGRKYRIPGAKGEKVDCNACHKQVSAAVNRLQSHLRVCPARPVAAQTSAELVADANPTPTLSVDAATADLGDASLDSVGILSPTAAATPAAAAGTEATLPAAKRPRPLVPPTANRPQWATTAAPADEPWAAMPSAYAKRRLEIEEQRLQLELKRERREQSRERFELEILEARARKERLAAEKEAYEARTMLALSRKQLRDQGVSEDEIDRVLPVEPVPVAAPNGHAEAAAANAAASAALEAANKLQDHHAVL